MKQLSIRNDSLGCAMCGDEQKKNAGPDREVNICGIYIYFYRRPRRGKRKLQSCGRINLCEKCLAHCCAGPSIQQTKRLAALTSGALRRGYNASLQQEQE